VADVQPGYLAPQLPTHAPTDGEPWEDIQRDIQKMIVPGLTHWQHPNFMAFFPSNVSYPGILGELYSSVYSAPAFNWLCSPAITELETVMMDWVAQMIGLPECFLSKTEGGGVIQGTASEAIVTVMVAARERALARLTAHHEDEKQREDATDALRGKLVAIGSEHAHSSTQKGALIAGTKVRSVPVQRSDAYGMRGSSLASVLENCKSEGLIPYYMTVSLGTTNTCAVDNFEEIENVLRGWPDVWVHVDAAYAGSALCCPEYQHLTKTFSSFDSVDINMHKWMLTNFDLRYVLTCCCLKLHAD
jgi:aromatic-L-amino-acid decarboxylase